MKVLLKCFQIENDHDTVIFYGAKILIAIISINIDYCLFNGFVLDLFQAQNLDRNLRMSRLQLFGPHTEPI